MLCERCNEKEATVHLTQVIEGAVKKLHLCEACAKESGFDMQGSVSITDVLLGMGHNQGDVLPDKVAGELSCSRCGMTRTEFKKRGRLGCPACYTAFYDELSPLLKAVHHSEQHLGKVPGSESVRIRMTTELAAYQQAIDEAIAAENYEEAARLRDKIKHCRERIEQEQASEK
jgi:protein arginine kinase activator